MYQKYSALSHMAEEKYPAWEQLTNAVTTVSPLVRTVAEVKKKIV